MKLSDIKGERTLEVIADIIDPIANIAESDAAKALFKKEKLPEGMTPFAFAAKRIRASAPKLLKDNKKEIISILAAISGQSYEEFSSDLNLASLVRGLNDLVTDEVFVELFMHAQTDEPSGSAPENIEAH